MKAPLFSLLLFIAIFRYRERIRTERLELQLSVLENEQRALTAQINPHFIYNAMNSVQYYVLEEERAKAADLLAQFSNLMRKVLTNTKSSLISLEEELSILKLYLTLEKERFEHRFEYSFEVADSLDTDALSIPSMVVQPHIENAIWHGLLPKSDGVARLTVAVHDMGNSIDWVITDNGVGRGSQKQAATHVLKRQGGYTSSGIRLTERRLNLLAQKTGKGYAIRIADLKSESGEPLGTEVTITMAKDDQPANVHHR